MNDFNASENSNFTDDIGTQKERKRISYVSKDLKSSIEFVAKVYNQLGHTTYHSNKAIAAVHGLSHDSIKLQLSSAQQYKILEIKHGIGYKVTDHFQKLYLPRNDNEKRQAVIESLKNAETYQQLFKDYEFHVVPLDGVRNYFIRTYGMKEDVSLKAAQVFIENLKDFDLLDNRGVLLSGLQMKPLVPDIKPEGEDVNVESDEMTVSPVPENLHPQRVIYNPELDVTGKKTIPIHLIDNKQALFVYPNDITEDDIELVKHQIEGILLRIKLESKKREPEKK